MKSPIGAERGRLGQLLPHECQRIVVAAAPLVLVGENLAQADVGPLRKGRSTPLGPLKRIIETACLPVQVGDLNVVIGVGRSWLFTSTSASISSFILASASIMWVTLKRNPEC